jgi:hypothetical protein
MIELFGSWHRVRWREVATWIVRIAGPPETRYGKNHVRLGHSEKVSSSMLPYNAQTGEVNSRALDCAETMWFRQSLANAAEGNSRRFQHAH